jgi:hypothetical protein
VGSLSLLSPDGWHIRGQDRCRWRLKKFV